jgi:hypothetical protein
MHKKNKVDTNLIIASCRLKQGILRIINYLSNFTNKLTLFSFNFMIKLCLSGKTCNILQSKVYWFPKRRIHWFP